MPDEFDFSESVELLGLSAPPEPETVTITPEMLSSVLSDVVQMDVDAMSRLVQASVSWAQNTGDCHFCGAYQRYGAHDEGCPVYPFDPPNPAGEYFDDPPDRLCGASHRPMGPFNESGQCALPVGHPGEHLSVGGGGISWR